jgi:mannose-6-phosphate isomerase
VTNDGMIPSVVSRPYRMLNEILPYEWGTRDREAFIPHLLGIDPEPGRPYAELWIGAHPKAPSRILVDGREIPIQRWIETYPEEILGESSVRRFGSRLPFLLKVLSAGEALSIQAHPNKAQAEELHSLDPQNYPDDNHKPEIAIALDGLSALLGVKPLPELLDALDRYHELAAFVGEEACERVRNGGLAEPIERSRILFDRLLSRSESSPQELDDALKQLAGRLTTVPEDLTETDALFLELRAKYSGPDVGLFFIFLLNLVNLVEGQAVFLEAGVPHAYLKGNIIECMANSDNVVRAGLTPKYKDAETLLRIMDFEPRLPRIQDAGPGQGIVRYISQTDEFEVERLRLDNEDQVFSTEGRLGFLLVTHGQPLYQWEAGIERGEMELKPGQVVLLPAILPGLRIVARGRVEIFCADVPVA